MQKFKASWPVTKLSALATLCLCTFFIITSAQPPNYTETTVNNIDGSGNNITSRTYTDGLDRQIQSQTLDNSTDKAVVTGTEYDNAGRPVKTVKSFPYTDNTSLDYISGDLPDMADSCYGYPEKDSAYSSIQYYDDPLGRVKAAGAPGKNFTATAHPVKTWYFGVTGTNDPATCFDGDGFVNYANLNDNDLGSFIPTALKGKPVAYYLTVTMDPNGNFTQELKDIFGNTVRTWALADTTGGPIVSRYSHDIVGNVLSETPPRTPGRSDSVKATTYNYNTMGQLVSKTTPDAGTTAYAYDAEGRLSTVTDAKGNVLTYAYDDLGRNLTISRKTNEVTNTRIRNVYDVPEDACQYLDSSAFTRGGVNLNKILDSLTNTEGRVVATIAYDEAYNAKIAESTYTGKVIDLYSYDDEGHVERKYKSIPGLPLQTTAYTYDIHGKLLSDTIRSGSVAPVVTTYTYDENGRLFSIFRGGDTFVQYSYDDLGRMIQKHFVSKEMWQIYCFKDYNIRDWPALIFQAAENYRNYWEWLYYDSAQRNEAANQYNGNISRIYESSHVAVIPAPGGDEDLLYTYDWANRLTQVQTIWSWGGAGIDYNASFSYLNDGRILQKHEGTDQQGWGNYVYDGNTNKLQGIASSGTKTGTNFIYDSNGNMVLDRSKKMSIEYDWRNIPVKFRFFDTIPTSVNDWLGVQSLISTSGVKLQSEVVMTYDASGNRVNKEQFDYTQCTVGDPTDSSLVITDTVSKVSMFIDTDGSIKTCLAVTPFMPPLPNPDAIEGLKIENTTTHEVLFAITPSALLSGTITTTAYVDTGLEIVYKSMGGAVVIGADGGYVSVTGQIPRKIPITGVAYVDGSHVFVWDLGTSSYNLSYVNVAGEGCSRADGSFVFHFKDHLGSTRMAVTEDCQVLDATQYLAYGTEKYLQTAPADARTRDKFTGKEFDSDVGIGLTYFGARYYDPEVAVFTSTDPEMDKCPVRFPSLYQQMPPGARLAALVGAKLASEIMDDIAASGYDPSVINKWQNNILSNPYDYCFNNAINFVDPDGRWGWAHFYMTWFLEHTHQRVQSFNETWNGIKDVGAGIVKGDLSRIGQGFKELGTGAVRKAFAPVEATGTAVFAEMADVENQLYKWFGWKIGPGWEAGAHGFPKGYKEYIEEMQEERRGGSEHWWQFGRRWSAKGHLYHTAQDVHIHRNKYLMGSWREFWMVERWDYLPIYWIPGIFFTYSSSEEAVYGK